MDTAVIHDYIRKVLGMSCTLHEWEEAGRLPLFLNHAFDFSIMTLAHAQVLLLQPHALDSSSPRNLTAGGKVLRNYWKGPIAYVFAALTGFERRRLIEAGIPFLVPGTQMYLPFLAMDLRERSKRVQAERGRLSPSSQMLFLFLLLDENQAPITQNEAGRRLGFTIMTVSRAFSELRGLGLISMETRGRAAAARIGTDRREAWNRALPFLCDPVARREYLTTPPEGVRTLRAGLDALSKYTMLNEPSHRIMALSASKWRRTAMDPNSESLRSGFTIGIPSHVEIEIWRYDPVPLAEGEVVDPFSLWLSLREDDDVRTRQQLSEMLEARL